MLNMLPSKVLIFVAFVFPVSVDSSCRATLNELSGKHQKSEMACNVLEFDIRQWHCTRDLSCNLMASALSAASFFSLHQFVDKALRDPSFFFSFRISPLSLTFFVVILHFGKGTPLIYSLNASDENIFHSIE